jgi:hypothetical protein
VSSGISPGLPISELTHRWAAGADCPGLTQTGAMYKSARVVGEHATAVSLVPAASGCRRQGQQAGRDRALPGEAVRGTPAGAWRPHDEPDSGVRICLIWR